jgi:hypothetical protein
MNFIIKFEKNLREKLNYSCVDHKAEFILFYFYTKRYIRKEDLSNNPAPIDRAVVIRRIKLSTNTLVGSVVINTTENSKGINNLSIFIIFRTYLLTKPMTQ